MCVVGSERAPVHPNSGTECAAVKYNDPATSNDVTRYLISVYFCMTTMTTIGELQYRGLKFQLPCEVPCMVSSPVTLVGYASTVLDCTLHWQSCFPQVSTTPPCLAHRSLTSTGPMGCSRAA